MSKPIGLREQVKILIAEQPGISSKEIAEFFTELKNHESQVSAVLSHLYGEGGYRRERTAGERSFRYWPDPDAKPQPIPHKGKQTEVGAAVDLVALREEVVELRAWKADAIARFPALAVPPLVLKARQVVADQLRDCSDPEGAKAVLAGNRDHTTLLKAVVRALELTA